MLINTEHKHGSSQLQNATGRQLPRLAWRGRSLLWSLIEGFKEFKLGWRGGIRRRARERRGEAEEEWLSGKKRGEEETEDEERYKDAGWRGRSGGFQWCHKLRQTPSQGAFWESFFSPTRTKAGTVQLSAEAARTCPSSRTLAGLRGCSARPIMKDPGRRSAHVT